ncbi:PLP-dependent aspartate aminotransferase family protein [Oceanobacillus jordanicus]|uniref:O-acetylhomoserine aminocarboxypropyltransferase/cysteine synthase n=1 Tax=Oceanobacillus jordanicus TaxID=2867266 RepID=A0AAW5B3N6_9BACI|nr:O-acetylhomoserine aminocarboxypropyltransferase/cysteine synthase family protein [Oceanobacillus jordanicus]MCG3417857.1 O-acetylhomoserine aminocarboxypropyltransferase/cysteine synthase [Oceanobacillus jordanicus]
MSSFTYQQDETTLLHGGQVPDPSTGARAVPIYQTTSYVFNNTEHAQNLFGLSEAGNIYSRIGNPTVDVFEQRIAQLEDGVAAVATSSGMAAISFAILNIAGSGDEIVADSNLYGGTYNLFTHTLPRYGITVKFVDGTDLEEIKNAITDKTKAIFGEIITNPSLNIFDVEAVSAIAHQHGIPLIIDNTFAPYLTKPLTWGADVVVHSATKWIGGHGTTIGGVVVDGGRFNWNNARFKGFTEPQESYNGLRFIDVGAAAFATKLRVELLRDIGACLSPQSAFQLLQGLETLHLRIEKHTKNAQEIAAYLADHPAVEWVNYPGLQNHPSHQLAKKYLKNGYGSIITFGIKGGREAGRKLIDSISLWSHVANVGDAKSLIIHPASTTHQQLNPEELKSSGVSEELVRLSIGLEATSDLLSTLDEAINQAVGKTTNQKPSEKDAIEWLVRSPFDRSDGTVRQKAIAVYTEGNNREVNKTIEQLKALGFLVPTIQQEINGEENRFTQLADVPYQVDAVYVDHNVLPSDTLEQFINKQSSILWVRYAEGHTQLIENAEATGITVVSGNTPYDEFIRLRGGLPESVIAGV